MKTNQIILFVIIISLSGCNKKAGYTENQCDNRMPHSHDVSVNGTQNNNLAKMSVKQLLVANRKIAAKMRENYRSWRYDEPDRWKYLAGKFADEVIHACPDAYSKREEVAEVYLNLLNQQAAIFKSDAKNKNVLMGNSSAEFIYELKFLIGVEEWLKWETLSKLESQKFKFKSDSITLIISYQQQNIN